MPLAEAGAPRRGPRWLVPSNPLEALGSHLQHVLATYVAHYNEHRPHRRLEQRPPIRALSQSHEQPAVDVIDLDRIRRRNLLGGLVHEYCLAA